METKCENATYANSALLVMDYQNLMIKILGEKAKLLLLTTNSVIEAARAANIPIIYIVVQKHLHSVNQAKKGFDAKSLQLLEGSEEAKIHPEVAPKDNDAIVVKRRVSAFYNTELGCVLSVKSIKHLILTGISTSGVVLSTTRWAADADFTISIIEDCCADQFEDVHQLLINKVLSKQADIIKAKDFIAKFPSTAPIAVPAKAE